MEMVFFCYVCKLGNDRLLLVYIVINNCDWQDAVTTKWHSQLTGLVARNDFSSVVG